MLLIFMLPLVCWVILNCGYAPGGSILFAKALYALLSDQTIIHFSLLPGFGAHIHQLTFLLILWSQRLPPKSKQHNFLIRINAAQVKRSTPHRRQ